MKYLIGIDEVGRGPLAGPVGVGVVLIPYDFDWSFIEGVGDSKKLTPENREAIFRQTKHLKQNQQLNFAVTLVKAEVIDKIGIVPAIRLAMARGLKKITTSLPETDLGIDVMVKLDGGLKAPAVFKEQETIIKGDSKEKVIGLASIMAKVTRDKRMEKLAKRADFLNYGFEKHKGYGTKFHREMIMEYGLSMEHRRSFCKNILLL